MTWVKICGITTMRAGLAAAEAGADAVGFVFWPGSRRLVDPDRAQALIQGLPAALARVGVFVDAPAAEIARTAAHAGLTHLQLHGQEPPELLDQLPVPVLKGVRLGSAADLPVLLRYTRAWGILVEPHVSTTAGGAGVALDRDLAVQGRDLLRQAGYAGKIILAGGLNPDSVGAAIRAVAPDGVDVSSGVEAGGQKDLDLIYRFIAAARGANP